MKKEQKINPALLNKFAYTTISMELLRQSLHLPNDAVILKIIPTPDHSLNFDIFFCSEVGYHTGEEAVVARINREDIAEE